MHGQQGETVGDMDDDSAHRAMDNFGAFILRRNMLGPRSDTPGWMAPGEAEGASILRKISESTNGILREET
jgi:hypothetical protein